MSGSSVATATALTRLIAVTDVAELLGVEARHVRRLVHERRIPFIKWGHLLRFDPLELSEWIDSHRHGDCRTPTVALSSHRRPVLADPPRDS